MNRQTLCIVILALTNIIHSIFGGHMLDKDCSYLEAEPIEKKPLDTAPAAVGDLKPRQPMPRALWKSELFTVTAYCPCEKCCGKQSPGVTASGMAVTEYRGRFIAAPRRFEFGTAFRIPGYANGDPVPVLDRGGAIKGNRIDVYFPTHKEALQWGFQQLNVTYFEQEKR